MGANIELWTYRLFRDSHIYFEEVGRKSFTRAVIVYKQGKDPKMVAGKKAATIRAS